MLRAAVIQRLFSTFPDSWPGIGLLLLRAAAAIAIMSDGVLSLWVAGEPLSLAMKVAAFASGGLLLLGLWTPFASAAQAFLELWLAVVTDRFALHFLIAVIGVSLIALGPGAWSVDSKLFGRRRIDL